MQTSYMYFAAVCEFPISTAVNISKYIIQAIFGPNKHFPDKIIAKNINKFRCNSYQYINNVSRNVGNSHYVFEGYTISLQYIWYTINFDTFQEKKPALCDCNLFPVPLSFSSRGEKKYFYFFEVVGISSPFLLD